MTCKRCANEDSNHQVSKLSRSDGVVELTTETINCPVAIDLNLVESIPSNRGVVTKTLILENKVKGDRVIDQTTETINCPVAIDLNPVESILVYT